jgi:hypothetical protein
MKKANKKDSFSGQRQQRDEEGAEGAETGVGASNISGSLIHYLLDQRNDMSKERFLERPFAERAAWRMHNWALITMASNAIAVLKRARTDPIGNEITSLYQVF